MRCELVTRVSYDVCRSPTDALGAIGYGGVVHWPAREAGDRAVFMMRNKATIEVNSIVKSIAATVASRTS